MTTGGFRAVALPGLPPVQPNDDLAALLLQGLQRAEWRPDRYDILVVAQKLVSKAEGRYVSLGTLTPSDRAVALASETAIDARLIELILSQSRRVVRAAPGVLIVQHRLGHVMANAGIDQSNLDPRFGADTALLLPENPDRSAAALRQAIADRSGAAPAVIISDSFGRAWRRGSIGVAIGIAGLPAVQDRRGLPDLFGRTLRVTQIAFADMAAAAAVLLMGEGSEGRPAVLLQGLAWPDADGTAADIIRPAHEDLFQ
jgi:coenzyme F420-0:L-glutamate ligase/coenzyme F420-1:gamma-L-glutamate ligase